MDWWMTAALVWVGLCALIVFAVALRPYRDSRRGGMVDLTGAQPRGELDLDWADPRTKQQAQEFADYWAERAKVAARR